MQPLTEGLKDGEEKLILEMECLEADGYFIRLGSFRKCTVGGGGGCNGCSAMRPEPLQAALRSMARVSENWRPRKT